MPDWWETVGRLKTTDIDALVWAHPLAHPANGTYNHLCRIFGTGEARIFEFGVRIDLG